MTVLMLSILPERLCANDLVFWKMDREILRVTMGVVPAIAMLHCYAVAHNYLRNKKFLVQLHQMTIK